MTQTALNSINGTNDAKWLQNGANSIKRRKCKRRQTAQMMPHNVKTAQTASNGVFRIKNSASAPTTKKIHQQIHRQHHHQ
jgi:hypothetical protein